MQKQRNEKLLLSHLRIVAGGADQEPKASDVVIGKQNHLKKPSNAKHCLAAKNA